MKPISRVLLASSTILLGAMLASVAGANGHKVTICHKGQEISVSENAVDAHLRNHGDTVGPCQEEEVCPCWTTEQIAGLIEVGLAQGAEIDCDYGEIEREGEDLSLDGGFQYFNALGYVDLDVDFDFFDGEVQFAECEVWTDDVPGVETLEVSPITLGEAEACRRAIADQCPALLP